MKGKLVFKKKDWAIDEGYALVFGQVGDAAVVEDVLAVHEAGAGDVGAGTLAAAHLGRTVAPWRPKTRDAIRLLVRIDRLPSMKLLKGITSDSASQVVMSIRIIQPIAPRG